MIDINEFKLPTRTHKYNCWTIDFSYVQPNKNVNLDRINIVNTKIEVQGAKRGTINKQNQKAMLMFLHRI